MTRLEPDGNGPTGGGRKEGELNPRRGKDRLEDNKEETGRGKLRQMTIQECLTNRKDPKPRVKEGAGAPET